MPVARHVVLERRLFQLVLDASVEIVDGESTKATVRTSFVGCTEELGTDPSDGVSFTGDICYALRLIDDVWSFGVVNQGETSRPARQAVDNGGVGEVDQNQVVVLLKGTDHHVVSVVPVDQKSESECACGIWNESSSSSSTVVAQ